MMTLILSCLTEDYAIQVSDRRLTNLKGEVVENNENKAIDWAGSVAFGYTGLARILSQPTDCWLSEALLINTSSQGTISLNESIDNARAKATKDFKIIPVKDKRWKRLTIIGVGWIHLFDTNQSKPQLFDINKTKPAICWISNCLDDEGNTQAEAYEEFTAKLFMFNHIPNGFLVVPIGQHLNHHRTNSLLRNIAKCIKHEGIGPEPISRLLIETIRDVARENITVGRSVMVACIPKESLHRSIIPMSDGSIGFLVSSSKPQKFDRTFQYVPDGQDEGIEYGPNFVFGGSWLRDFSASRVRNKDSLTVAVRTMTLEPGAKQGVIMFEDGTNAQFISPPQKGAIDEYEQAISDIDKTLSLDPSLQRSYTNRGNLHCEKGSIEKTILNCNKTISLNPEDASSYNERAFYYAKIGNYNEAIIDASKAISLNPKYEEAYINRVTAFMKSGQLDKAINDIDKAININSNSAKPYSMKGVIYRQKGEYDLAIAEFNKAISLDQNLFEAYGDRGMVYILKGLYDLSISDFSNALRINPKSDKLFLLYSSRGLAYLKKNAYIKAINDLNKAIMLNPNDAIPFHNRGLACQKIGKLDLAIRDQNKAVGLNPSFFEAYNFRGVTFALMGDRNRAILDFDEAIRLKPDYSEAYNNRGLVYLNKGDLETALTDFNKSIALKDNYEARYNRGLLYIKKEEKGKAIKDFNEALQLAKDPAIRKNIVNQINCMNGE